MLSTFNPSESSSYRIKRLTFFPIYLYTFPNFFQQLHQHPSEYPGRASSFSALEKTGDETNKEQTTNRLTVDECNIINYKQFV